MLKDLHVGINPMLDSHDILMKWASEWLDVVLRYRTDEGEGEFQRDADEEQKPLLDNSLGNRIGQSRRPIGQRIGKCVGQ